MNNSTSQNSQLYYIFLKSATNDLSGFLPLISTLPIHDILPFIRKRLHLLSNCPLTLMNPKTGIVDLTMTLIEQGITPYSELIVCIEEEKNAGEIASTPEENKNGEKSHRSEKDLIDGSKELSIHSITNYIFRKFLRQSTNQVLTNLIEDSMHFENDVNFGRLNPKMHSKPILEEVIEQPIEEEKANRADFMKSLIKAQAFFRMKKSQKFYSTLKKKMKNRRYIIEELIKTEDSYKRSLFLVLEKVVNPLKLQKILNKEEIEGLFSNLESLASFSNTFYLALLEKFNYNFEPAKTKIAETVLLLLPFFKLYFEYCHNFKTARALILEIRSKNSKFIKFMEKLEMSPEFEFQDLDSELIKPVQRLPKYVLLFRDLLKNTEKTHPDYHNIELCIQQFSALNSENDKKIDQKVKIFDLEVKFSSELPFSLPESTREFLEEFNLVMLTDKSTLVVIVYFLTDMMLVTEQSTYCEPKLVKYLTFDYNSYVKDLPNSRYFKYCVSIFGKEGGLTFIFNEKTEKFKIIEFMNEKIFKKRKKPVTMNKKILTGVLGTVPRGLDHIKPYTIYIVQVTCDEIQYRVFLRYKELLNLESSVSGLGSTKIDKLPPKHFWTEQKPRTIESRKIHIESFLHFVLTNEAVMKQREKVLENLGLPRTFYEIENLSEEIKQKNKNFLLNPDNAKALALNKRKCVYKSLLEMYKNSKRVLSLDEGLNKIGPFKKIEVVLPSGEKLWVEISKTTKTFEVCRDLAEAAGLSSWLDYKLCLVSSAMDETIIDDEEYLYRALNIDMDVWDSYSESKNTQQLPGIMTKKSVVLGKEKTMEKNQIAEIIENDPNKVQQKNPNENNQQKRTIKQWFAEVKSDFTDFINRVLEKNLYCNSQLMFKKAFYLSSELEEVDYKTDLVRLDLMMHQAWAELSQSRLILSLMDYCLFGALKIYMKYGPIYSLSSNDFERIFKEAFFSNAVPTLILYKENFEFWFENVSWYWKVFSDEIERIIQRNQEFNNKIAEKILEKLVKGNQCEIQKKTVDGKTIAKFVFLKCMFKTALYGSHRCFVSLITKDEKQRKARTVWLAISYESLRFLEDKNCQELFKIFYDEIESVYATASFVDLNLKYDKHTFFTMKGFEIREIIEFYRRIKKIVAALGKKRKPNKKDDKKYRRSGFS